MLERPFLTMRETNSLVNKISSVVFLCILGDGVQKIARFL